MHIQSDLSYLNFELVKNNDGNAHYEFREPRFNQARLVILSLKMMLS